MLFEISGVYQNGYIQYVMYALWHAHSRPGESEEHIDKRNKQNMASLCSTHPSINDIRRDIIGHTGRSKCIVMTPLVIIIQPFRIGKFHVT